MKTPSKSATLSPSTPEATLAGLVMTRANLQARHSAVAVEVEQAVATRRRLLIDGADKSGLADADRACREIESTAFGIADALAEVERRIASTEARIAGDRERAHVESVAAGLERNASEIESGAAALGKALAEVARCKTNLTVAMSGAAAGQFDPVNGLAMPSQIAAEFTMQGLIHALPDIEFHAVLKPWSGYDYRQPVAGIDPVVSAAEFADRIRATAGQIRAGEIGPALPEGYEPEPSFQADRRETQVYVLAAFFYQNRGVRVMVTSGSQPRLLPAPVADLALANDLASIEAPPKRNIGSAALVDTSSRWEDCIDLNFDLSAWQAENVEAQRAAFRAGPDRKAA